MVLVRLIDRHSDHFHDTHGRPMPVEVARGRTVRSAMALAAEWADCWCGDGMHRQQWKRRRPTHLRSEHEARRVALQRFRAKANERNERQ